MNIEDIKVTNNSISYSALVKLVEIAVKNSFSASTGEYHEYLRDFGETFALLIGFTNYTFGDDNKDGGNDAESLFEEVMTIAHNSKWINEIIPDIGGMYDTFMGYVESEIEQINMPFKSIDKLIKTSSAVVSEVNRAIKQINTGDIDNSNFAKLAEAIGKVITADANLEEANKTKA